MRKRSSYRPRQIIHDTMRYVTTGFKPMAHNQDAVIALRIRNHSALAALVQGKATVRDIDELVAAYNMTATLTWEKIGDEYTAEVTAALNALKAVGDRGVKTGRFICTGPEIQALNLGMEIHDAQIDRATVNEVDAAIRSVQTVARKGLARKFGVAV